ncbi:MAG: hypothetical protein KF868_08300 [Acidobacteria bacterium]|nr:hypothetical protein [Acidobacteriota bacterium]
MRIKRFLKHAALIVLFCLLALAVFSLLYGPLLAWSPVKPGYDHLELRRADVYVAAGESPPADYAEIDRMMEEAEAFHGLRFHKKVTVIACRDWASCARYMPWMRVRGIGGVTLATGDVIYITPQLKEKGLSIAEFLRHELSHAVISQNTTIRKSIALTDQMWFSEGLAVSFGRQAAYLSRDGFLQRAADTELIVYLDPERMDRSHPQWSVRMAYPTQRYFLEYLKARFGAESFQRFMLAYMDAPGEYRRRFSEAFGLSLPDAVAEYQRALRERAWEPPTT